MSHVKEQIIELLRSKAPELQLDERLAGMALEIYEKYEIRFQSVDINIIPEMLAEILGALSYLMAGRDLDLAVKIGAIDMLKSRRPWTLPELVESLQLSLIVYQIAKDIYGRVEV